MSEKEDLILENILSQMEQNDINNQINNIPEYDEFKNII